MKEWQRTIALIVIIALMIGLLLYVRQQNDANFINTLN